MLGQKPITTDIKLHYMSFQLVFMYKHSIVTVYAKHSVEFIPYLTEKCSYMMTVHGQHKYPCIRILLKDIVVTLCWNCKCTQPKQRFKNGTSTCVVTYSMMQQIEDCVLFERFNRKSWILWLYTNMNLGVKVVW